MIPTHRISSVAAELSASQDPAHGISQAVKTFNDCGVR
jgi:hypothetical protein